MLSLGFGEGEDVVMNSNYQTVARIAGGNGLKADLHDFQIAPRDVAYITAYNPIRCDLTPVNGARRRRDRRHGDSGDRHEDRTRALGMAQPRPCRRCRSQTVEAPTGTSPWDYFHLNSIDPEPDGNLLISARNTWAGYQLDRRHAARSSGASAAPRAPSRWAPGTKMAWQHDARMLAGRRGHVLRRRLEPADPPPVARGADRARLQDPRGAPRGRLYAPEPAAARGEPGQHADAAPTGTPWSATAGCPQISEYAQDGSLLFDAHLPFDMSFYRAFRFPWSGQPAEPARGPRHPQQHRRRDDRARELERRNRRVLVAGARGQAARLAGGADHDPAGGFESSTILPAKYAYVAVQALDSAGHVLGTSQTAAVEQLRRLAPEPERPG